MSVRVYGMIPGLTLPAAPASRQGATLSVWSRNALQDLLVGNSQTDASAAWPAANRAIYVPFEIYEQQTFHGGFVYNAGTVSGNFDLAIFDSLGAGPGPGAKLASTGSTAQTGTTQQQLKAFSADITLPPGLYFMSLVFDNTTATVRMMAVSDAILLRFHGVQQQASAFPLPATATPANPADNHLPTFGIYSGTVI